MKIQLLAMLISLAPAEPVPVVATNTDMLRAWDAYVEGARSRMDERLTSGKPFLWVQESEPRMRLLRDGGIPVETSRANEPVALTGGLIHDWIGAVYVPGATASQILARLDEYEAYTSFYKPAVVDARLLSRDGDTRRFSLRYAKKVSVVNSVIDADYETSYFHSGSNRWWSICRSTRIQEVEHQGKPDERLQPVGAGAGYLWRYYSITRVMEVDHGVVLEMETIALSRDVPAAVAWFVNPIVNRFSRSALRTTLSQTREAVLHDDRAHAAGLFASER
jgi:hypothetical protein